MGCVTGIAECHDFGVRLPRRLRETRADLSVDHRAPIRNLQGGWGLTSNVPATAQLDRALHPAAILSVVHGESPSAGSASRDSIASLNSARS